MATISPELRDFLTAGTRTGKVATVRADGRPHVAPIWFIVEGDEIVFNTGEGTVKGKNLRRDPRIMISVDDDTPPYSFATIEGTATLSDDIGELVRTATLIGARYMGAERGEEFGKRNGVPGELVVRITPTKIIFQRDLAS
jgi:PPOX class probable F420-dependent enzyme